VPRHLDPLDGSERIGETGATIRGFWSWAYSDLRSNTERGIFTSSENGVAAECYVPEHSRIPGVATFA